MGFEVENLGVGIDAKYEKSSWELTEATVDVKNRYADDSTLIVR
jgi:hypothetical protein